MSEKLLIRLLSFETSLCEWALVTAQGQLAGDVTQGSLEEPPSSLSNTAAGRQVILLVPGEEVLLQRAALPVNNTSKVLQAAPYLLEESLTEDVETLHFTAGAKMASGEFPLAIIARERMRQLVDWLDAAGLNNVIALPEPLLLPLKTEGESAEWVALVEDSRVVFRAGQHAGFSVEQDSFPLLLEQLLQESGSTKGEDEPQAQRLRLIGHNIPSLSLPEGIHASLDEIPSTHTLAAFAPQVQNIDKPMNLLQVAFNRRPQLGNVFRVWRLTAALAFICLLVLMGGSISEYVQLKQRETELNAAIENVLKTTFPDIKRIVNPRAQMKSRLNALQRNAGGGGQFLPVLSAVSQGLSSIPGVTLNSLNYRAGRLDVEFDAKQLGEIDRLKQALEKNSLLKVTVQSANQDKDRVRGRLRVEMQS